METFLDTAIIDAETGEFPCPIHLHPTPPPTLLTHAFLRDDEISQHSSITIEPARLLSRYKISTLQIEPMTKRLTMNLGQKGKSIIINEDSKSTPRGSEAMREVDIKEEEEEEC